MNQQILEYLESSDPEVKAIGIELVVNLRSGISKYLNWAYTRRNYGWSTLSICIRKAVKERGEWSVGFTKGQTKVIIRRTKNNGSKE